MRTEAAKSRHVNRWWGSCKSATKENTMRTKETKKKEQKKKERKKERKETSNY